MVKVMLVEADAELVQVLGDALRGQGWEVVTATDGEQGLERWRAEQPDLVLLDTDLPQVDGYEVCRRMKRESSTPVILLATSGDAADVMRGLKVGADDYLLRPVNPEELIARLQPRPPRWRPRDRQPPRAIRIGNVIVDLQTRTVTNTATNQPIVLTPPECRILFHLALHEGRVVASSRLIECASGEVDEQQPALLKTHISRLRRKLGLPAQGPGSIRVISRVGYVLAGAARASTTTATQRAGGA